MSIATIGPDRFLRFQGQTFRAAIGEAGIAKRKVEGDSATPSGLLPLRRILYRADRVARPSTRLPTEPLSPQDGWCDEATDKAYNRMVNLPYDAHHEELWHRDELYDIIGILGWNDAPVERGRGSAIFLHCARPDYAPTKGCVALAMPDLVAVLAAGLDALQVG